MVRSQIIEIESPIHEFTKAKPFLLVQKTIPENIVAYSLIIFFLDCVDIDFQV